MSVDSKEISSLLKMIRVKHPNYHPLLELADIGMCEDTDIGTKVSCHKTIVKYVEQELRAIEVKAEVKSDFGLLRVTIQDDVDPLPPAPQPSDED